MQYRWYNEYSKQFLEQDYLLPNQTLDERVDIICNKAQEILNKDKKCSIDNFAKRFKENIQKGWYSLSTPIWTNFGTDRGTGISCFNSHISDDSESIAYTSAEVMMMSKYGGGTSGYFGELRERGALIQNGKNGFSSGSVHFMQMFDKIVNIWSQGKIRRGNFNATLPITHPDILEFLSIRDDGNPIQDISFSVSVSDEWMQSMIDGDETKRVIWAKVLESRQNKGFPYIFFVDTVNKNAPKPYIDKNLKINSSNMCHEITLNSNNDNSFVCDLSSMNILYYDEWKNTDAVKLLVYFLDSVMTDFIDKTSKIKFFERAVKFAKEQRAIGIGWLGYHSYLQNLNIPFESMESKYKNLEIAKTIFDQSNEASKEMASEYGEPDLLKGYGYRHITRQAIAPTKSSSFILGQVSEGIEPINSNYYVKNLAKGKFTIKNPALEKLLELKGLNNDETWLSILKNAGSVQHLTCLTKHEKEVFKTFAEISQMEVVIQAAQRQRFLDQSQSLNITIGPDIPIKDVNKLIIEGWKMGIKTFYYQLSVSSAQNFTRSILNCSSCES